MESRIFYLKLLIDYWLDLKKPYTANMWYNQLVNETGIEYRKLECEVELW